MIENQHMMYPVIAPAIGVVLSILWWKYRNPVLFIAVLVFVALTLYGIRLADIHNMGI